MKRYGLLLLVVILSATSLLAAAAYNTATVTNHATVKVVNTNQAVLAMSLPDHPDGDGVASIGADGELHLNFNRGMVGAYPTVLGDLGLQPHSAYYWEDLFTIRGRSNNSPMRYKIDLLNPDGTAVVSGNYKISVWTDKGTGWAVCHVNQNANTGNFRTENDPYFNKPIDVEILIPEGSAVGTIGNLLLVVTCVHP